MSFQSFGEILTHSALDRADRGFTYLVDGEKEEIFLSYAELDRQARSIAKVLRDRGLSNDQVLLLFPPGLEFIAALFGCFYEGAVAVPLAPPNPKRLPDELRRMAVLAADSRARAVITTQMFHGIFQSLPEVDPAFSALEFIVIEEALAQPALDWQPPRITKDHLAFLQYTSGSTGTPKGVMVTHANLIANSLLLQKACKLDGTTSGVSWLPMFHDFGLIGFVLQPVFLGTSCTILSPLAFLQRPVRWLQAISRYRGSASGAPNFAFELCVRRISDRECESLDLSSWKIAQCAAEPIRKSTLERFTERFSRYGFRGTTFSPCYGLAESTLLTTASPAGRGMITVDFSGAALEEGHARLALAGDPTRRTLVALGHTHESGTIAIASVAAGTRLPEGEIGEIWLSGPSVTSGYFGKPEQTAATFQATLAGEPGPFYLRTGDLGFLHDGELFMTGRIKDLLIIRGRNHYPQDIELTVESCADSLRAGCSAAFSVEAGEGEAPVVVAEVTAGTTAEAAAQIGAAIRQLVSERHGISLHALCVVPPGSVPKTSSGKLQRSRCRSDFLGGKLQPLWQWTAPAEPEPAAASPEPQLPSPQVAPAEPESPADAAPRGARSEEALAWLRARLAELARAAGAPLDLESPLTAYGLDSARLVGLSAELSDRLGRSLPPTFLFDHPTVAAVTRALQGAPARSEIAPERPAPDEPIAIVGMACRWPGGVTSPASYWELLAEGRDAIEPFPAARWDVEALYDPDPNAVGKSSCKHGGFLHGFEQFDASFFAIAPREAVAVEPQQRLVLETAWEAIESARMSPSRLAGSRTGVYLGSQGSDYRAPAADEGTLRTLDGYAGTGHASSLLSGRVAYALNLQGPALTVDTACSSSLVALHLACEGLRRGDCELAIAGGVQVMNTPVAFVEFSRLRGLAPDGRCKSFSARADGTAWSEGCGILLLKRLSDAERDGDEILALVRGTAINQDGRSQGLTAPNGPAQERVIRRALAQAGLPAGAIDVVEAHGTGTQLGDPIEAGALAAVFAQDRELDRPLYLGSSKSNLGHTQAAAGVAGVMKMVLSLQHERLPKTLHAEEPSPHIPWARSGLRLLQEPRPWPRSERVRRAGVSSFGISGTNAHVVLEEAPAAAITPQAPERTAELVVLSGRSEGAVRSQAARLRAHLQAHPDLSLGDIAYSLATTRSALDRRMVLVAASRQGLLDQLSSVERGTSAPGLQGGRALPGGAPRVVFVFPGQGAQWLGMGRTLLAEEPVFREALTSCDRVIAAEAGFSVLAELTADEASSRLSRIDVAQPVLFAMSVALAALWRSLGVVPDAVVGHSMGEIAAAHVAGALTLGDAAAIVCRRSRLLQRISGQGEMALVELSAAEAERAIGAYPDRLSVAVSNGPRSTVIAGEPSAITEVLAQLSGRGVFCRRVKVDVASHSPQVDPLREELIASLSDLAPRPLSIPMRSTVSGELLLGTELVASYWAQNLRRTVRFADTTQALLDSGHALFVEVSPHPILLPALEEIRQAAKGEGLAVGTLRRGQAERAEILGSLGALWIHGSPIAWEKLFSATARRVDLPTYAWQRERFWLETTAASYDHGRARARRGGHPLLGEVQRLATQPDTLLWDTSLLAKSPAWIADHTLRGAVVFPGAGHLEMALAAGVEALGSAAFAVTDLSLIDALVLPPDSAVALQVETGQERPGRVRFQVTSRQTVQGKTAFRVHSRAVLQHADAEASPAKLDLHELRNRMVSTGSSAPFYATLAAMGLELGPSFQGLRELWQGEGEALGRAQLPEAAGPSAGYQFHPALLDACLQVMAACFGRESENTPWVPVQIGKLRLRQRPVGEIYCHVIAAPEAAAGQKRRRAELCVTDGAGAILAEIRGLVVQRLDGAKRSEQDDWYLGVKWQAAHAPAPRISAGRWLLLGPGDAFGERLREALLRAGHAVERAEVPGSADALRDQLGSLFQGSSPTAVVHLAGLEERAAGGDPDLLRRAQRTCESVLRTVQALVGKGYRDVPRLWLLTRGAQALGAEEVSVAQSPLLGLGRTIALEHPELRCTRLDLDPEQPQEEAAEVTAELLADEAEEEIALRGRQRWVSRLVHRAPLSAPRERAEPAQGRPFRLIPEGAGGDGRLVLRAVERRPPGPGEVEIAVEAAGLEALDVRAFEEAAGGSESADQAAPQLGSACAGRIVAIGEGVQGLALGDPVLALAPGCFASHVIGPASWVLPAPQSLSTAQSAAIPVAFLAAYYALAKLAHLQEGERVLIHEGTSSVGLAAIQWAQHVGATVYATAGSADKRAHLASLGVRYVSDSQSDKFVEDVLRWTGGQGVDVVLGSLAGELIPRSLELLREQGRFVEFGGRDDYEGAQLGLRPFLRNLTFSRMDLGVMLRSRPARVRSLLQEVVGLFAAGVFVPSRVEELSIRHAADALRRMAQAQPIGSLVLSPIDPELRIQVRATEGVRIRKDSSYLISGGLGGLGLSVAAWLAEQGAGQLVLLSRKGAQSEAQQAAVEALRARGSQVLVAQADIADRGEVASVLREVDASGLPLRGVIHAAGVLADGVLLQQTPERFEQVLRPKVQGAWNLHELTEQRELDFFVMYSSAAGLMGSPGQGNYAAANSFLDALAHLRRAKGLHGLSIDWGTFSEVGLAAAEKNRGERLALRGMRSLKPQEGLLVMKGLLGGSEAQVGVVPLNLRQWGAFHQVALASPRLSELRNESAEAPSEGDQALLGKLRAAPSAARAGLIAEHLRGQVAHVLRVAEEKVELDTPLTSLGLDSLMGLELRNRVEALFGIKMPATLLWTYPTLTALSGQLAKSIAGPQDEQAAPVSAESAVSAQPDAVEIADEEELLALLDESIARAEKKVLR